MHILHRSNYLVFFDDVRVDPYLIEWSTSLGLFADAATASVTLHRAPRLNKWKAYLTQVRVFVENPFTKKFSMVFEGEITNRSWGESRSNSGTVTYNISGFYHWLNIAVPMGITHETEFSKVQRFIYEAQNIDIEAVRELMISREEAMGMNQNIEQLIKSLYEKLTIGYYDVAGENTTLAFAKILERFKVMVDVKDEFRTAGFLDVFTFTNVSNIQSFYEYLNDVLSQLMFEFYQDRDGSFRIKTPSWGDNLLKAHVIDASLIAKITGIDAWNKEPTRVLAMGSESQMLSGQSNLNTSSFNQNLTLPIGLYIGNPRDPESEVYYSQMVDYYMENFGRTGDINEEDYKYMDSGKWFNNLSNYKVNSDHRSKNPGRKDHYGVDFNFKYENVYNIGTNGTVKRVGSDGSRGNYIQIEQVIDGQTYTFQYMHLNSLPSLKAGQRVSPGALLGVSGNTGESTGAHLHFEIWRGDVYTGTDLEPLDFLSKISVAAKDFHDPTTYRMADAAGGVVNKNAKISTDPTSIGTGASTWDAFHISAYTAYCAGCIGITKSGIDVRDTSKDHRIVAVDPSVIPLGSIVEIEGLGYYTAADIGGAIKGKKLDLLVSSNSAANAWGRRNMRVRVIRRGDGERVQPVSTVVDPHTLITGSSSAKYDTLTKDISVPKSGSSASGPVSLGGGSATTPLLNQRTDFLSNTYANVDGFRADNRFGGGSSTKKKKKKKKDPVGMDGSLSSLVYSIPSHSPAGVYDALKVNPHGIDGNLLGSIVSATSGFKERFNAGGRVGVAGIPQAYADAVLGSYNLYDSKVNIDAAAEFLATAKERFNGKTTFALAAYHMGGFDELASKVTTFGSMDFAAMREAGLIPQDTLAFVDQVLGEYLKLGSADYLNGDPHKAMDTAATEDVDVPDDFDDMYKLTLSDEERRYKINLVRVEQPLIRLDNAAVGSFDMAEKLIYQFAKYTMMLHRAQSHSVTCQLTTCLPFIRPGYNVWLEPTRTDVVGYITGVTHFGSFHGGCSTSLTSGFIRRPDDYTEIDESIFASNPRATSSAFGQTLTPADMTAIREQLKQMHELDSVDMAHRFEVLNGLYSSMNETNEYTTMWNAEMTKEEIIEKIASVYADAPEVVLERKAEIKEVMEESEEFFISKLLFERTGGNG